MVRSGSLIMPDMTFFGANLNYLNISIMVLWQLVLTLKADILYKYAVSIVILMLISWYDVSYFSLYVVNVQFQKGILYLLVSCVV